MTFGRWLTQADLLAALDILGEVHSVVSRGWCRLVSAEDIQGRSVERDSPQAVRFSLTSALYRATRGDARFYRVMNQLGPTLKRRGMRSLGELNDHPDTDLPAVLGFLGDAAADIALRAEGLPPGTTVEEEREQLRREIEDA